MNKSVIIGIVLVLVAALGIGAYVMNSKSTSPSTGTMGSTQPTPQNAMINKLSLKDLIQAGSNQQCTFSDTEAKTSGTVYLGGGKMRGDFQSEADGKPFTSHMINDGTAVYIWMDNQPGGFKASMDAVEQASAGINMQTIDINKPSDYACEPWSVDGSKFTVPTTIQFSDMSSMMKMISPVTTGGAMMDPNSGACAACNNLPGDSKAECLTALSCN